MKQFSIFFLVLALSTKVFGADVKSITINLSSIKVQKATSTTLNKSILNQHINGFSTVSVEGFDPDRTVGAPELPVRSWLLQGTPEQIQVTMNVKKQEILANVKPMPVQEQDCRCETSKTRNFQYNVNLYKSTQPYKLSYLGAFRGTPITRVDVNVASYDAAKNQVVVKTQMDIRFNVPEFSFQPGDYRDYLIITTGNLKSSVNEFASWKKSQGYNVSVEEVTSPTLESVSALIKKYYAAGTDFVIIVGDQNAVPMYSVSTSGASNTPTDLKYFTMDGGSDYVPDMFYSRIVAADAAQVTAQLNKSLEYEQKAAHDVSGFKKVIGIASDEGSNPSDNEYVTGIEENFQSVLGTTATHFHQGESNSNPTDLNKSFDEGAFWVTYVGHGSGTDWASMNQWYNVRDVKNIKNRDVVKPVVIDVACMNGVIENGYLGTQFLNTPTNGNSDAFGAVAYYGGTVNISWNPPAIMATGIVSEHLSKKFKHLGEALLAGQLYLAGKWSNQKDVIDNMEWYHLQGDPGMNIEF
jgi:hypothetical protein